MVKSIIFDSMKPLVEEHSVMQIDVVFNLVEDPLSDLIAELPVLVGFDHSDNLSCSDCDGDYICLVCVQINSCINGVPFALTWVQIFLRKPLLREWRVILHFLMTFENC